MQDVPLVSRESMDHAQSLAVPHPDGSVQPAGENPIAIWRIYGCPKRRLMTLQESNLSSRLSVSDADVLFQAAGGEFCPIG